MGAGTSFWMWSLDEHIAEATRPCYMNGFFLRQEIGGGFARIHEVCSRQCGKSFACKIVPRAIGDNDIFDPLQADISALILLSHPNVIQGFKFFRSDHLVYLVLELCPGGSVKDVILRSGAIPSIQLRRLCRETAVGLAYCHSQGVAHRDIKRRTHRRVRRPS
jgi:serine/threonine protein kinase